MQGDYDVQVEGKAFVLRPDTPKEGKPRTLRPGETPGSLSEPLKTHAEQAGLVMRRPPLTSWAMYALEATEYAKEKGAWQAVHRGLYRAYWEDGKDLGNLDVVRGVAESSGLDWTELRDRLESRHYASAVTAQYQEALALGIRGIPAFAIGNILFTGARPYEVFKLVMDKALGQQAEG